MNRYRITAAMLGLLSAYFAPSMRADDTNKETHLTVKQPLQVQNTLLAPGQYVVKLTDPYGDHSIVSIFDADSTRLEGIVIGYPAYRTDAGDKNLLTISQPKGNQPAKLRTWFYPGDNFGVEFPVTKGPGETGMYSNSTGRDRTPSQPAMLPEPATNMRPPEERKLVS